MIKIITDSASDITQAEAQKLGIKVIPLTINFEGQIFEDGIGLDKKEFFAKLTKTEILPTTSQINPTKFEQAFSEYCDDEDTEIIVICISSKLSATMQSALIAAQNLCPEKIFVIDSLSASLGEELLIREALRIISENKGISASSLAKILNNAASKLRVFGIIETLKYLKMGGRLSGSAALIGEVLGILPVIQIKDGYLEAIGKVRGEKNAMKKFAEMFNSYDIDYAKGIVFSNADDVDKMEKYIDFIQPPTSGPIYKSNIGSVIGTHTGPGLIAVAFFEK